MSDYMLGKNPYQGSHKKALFVCTGGILRSATAAHYAAQHKGWNTRSCGIMEEAIPPISRNLLEWADHIFCLEVHHQQFINQLFGDAYNGKITVLGIPDNFAYRDPELVKLLSQRLATL
jgi:predicted protein tyrosine phosphatase